MKEGLGASEVDVSALSAGFPKGNVGVGCSVAALDLLKEKPPVVAAAGAASASLLAAPKRKLDGAEEAAASFFSSGFPKVNVGAAGSFSVDRGLKVEPPCGAVVVRVGPPNLEKTDPAVLVVVVAVLVFVDVVSSDDATLSTLS